MAATAEKTPASNGCFPIRLLKCCPGFEGCVPAVWQNVQDSTHLMILLGSIASIVILVINVSSLVNFGQCSQSFCFREVLALIAVVPNLGYFCKMLSQYDQAIMSRQMEIMRRRQEVVDSYEQLVTDIDSLLGKSTESSALLAEGGFESKRRDFMRFLERVEDQGSKMVFNEQMVSEFKKFVLHWLKIFSECSVDPINNPHLVVEADELDMHVSVAEIAAFVKERLKARDVKFIANQNDEDQTLLRGIKKNAKRMTAVAGDIQKMLMDENDAGVQEIEMAQLSGADPKAGASGGDGRGVALVQQPRSSAKSVCVACQWCKCGGAGFSLCVYKGPDGGSGFPKTSQCFCSELTVLSQGHMMLLGTFLFAVVYMGTLLANTVQLGFNGVIWIDLVCVAFYIWSLLVVLMQFEQIDIVQKLETEIQGLQKEQAELANKQTKMKSFWGDVQSLTDIWVYRTSPRLELMKEVHICIENVQNPTDLTAALTNTNQRINQLEEKMPALELWRHGGQISDASKKSFAKKIKMLSESADQNLPALLSGISEVTGDGVPQLKN